MPSTLAVPRGSRGCSRRGSSSNGGDSAGQMFGTKGLMKGRGQAAEVGTALLCIFNDRPMPGARESGKILFVTCWRCAEAPAPPLISGKMRMLAGWPVGRAGWSGAEGVGAAPRPAQCQSCGPQDGQDPGVTAAWSSLGVLAPARAWQRLRAPRSKCPAPPALSANNSFSLQPGFRGGCWSRSAISSGWHCLHIPSGHSMEVFVERRHLEEGTGTA